MVYTSRKKTFQNLNLSKGQAAPLLTNLYQVQCIFPVLSAHHTDNLYQISDMYLIPDYFRTFQG